MQAITEELVNPECRARKKPDKAPQTPDANDSSRGDLFEGFLPTIYLEMITNS